jgi:hypothetical protein
MLLLYKSTTTDFSHTVKLLPYNTFFFFTVKSRLAVWALCAEIVRTEGCSWRPKHAGFISESKASDYV